MQFSLKRKALLKPLLSLQNVFSSATAAAVFAWQAVKGEVSQDFMMIYTTVIAFYFGTQAQKLHSEAGAKHDDGASE